MSADSLQLVKLLEAVRTELKLRSSYEAQPQQKWSSVGFQDVQVNLADPAFNNNGNYPFPVGGYELTFLRRGSVPGALFQVQGGGQMTQPFAPGDQVKGWFAGGELQLSLFPGSVTSGLVTLRVAKNPQLHFRESPVEVPVTPVALLGTYINQSPDFATAQVEDIVPSGAQAGQFNATGWKRAAVFIDALDSGTAVVATSFQLLPYFRAPGDASRWYAQVAQLISMPDTIPTGGRYRFYLLDLAKMQGWVYLGIRNLLPAPNTLLSFCVVGVE